MPDVLIRLGDQAHAVPQGSSLADLVEALGHRADSVATGCNGDFVRRDLRAATLLQPGDRVSLFHPIVGG